MRKSSMRFQPYGIAALAVLSVVVNGRLLRAAALDVNAAGPAPDLAKLALFVDDLNSFLFSQRVTTISSARDKDGTRQEQIFSGGGFTLTKAGNYEHRFHARKVKLKKDAEEVLWDNRPRTRITLEGPTVVVYYLSEDGSQIVGGPVELDRAGNGFVFHPRAQVQTGQWMFTKYHRARDGSLRGHQYWEGYAEPTIFAEQPSITPWAAGKVAR